MSQTFIAYIDALGDDWRAENGGALCADFGIPDGAMIDEMARWHDLFSVQEEVFKILRRIYGIHPLLGVEEIDDMRAWTREEVASKLGMAVKDIDATLDAAKTFWRRHKLENERAKEPDREEKRDELTPELARKLLLQHGFVAIEDENERAYIANRIHELELWLENDQTRALARALIQSEVHIFFFIDKAITATKAQITRKEAMQHDITKENEQLMKLLKDRRDAVSAMEGTNKALGMDKGEGMRKRLGYQETLTLCMQGMQDYYADNSRELIDHIHTAAEVELLCTPLTLRPAQYRPDVVVSAYEAMQHFWDRDWKPTGLGRLASRRLRAGFEEGLRLIRAERNEGIADMGEEGDDAAAADEETQPAGPGAVLPQQTGSISVTPAATSRGEDLAD